QLQPLVAAGGVLREDEVAPRRERDVVRHIEALLAPGLSEQVEPVASAVRTQGQAKYLPFRERAAGGGAHEDPARIEPDPLAPADAGGAGAGGFEPHRVVVGHGPHYGHPVYVEPSSRG